MKKIVLMAGIANSLFAFFDPDYVTKAEDELTLHYINNNIYYPVNCRNVKVNKEYYILCSDGAMWADQKQGGLFKVIDENNDKYTILAINGKAMQHSKGKYKEYRDPNLDIPKIINEF